MRPSFGRGGPAGPQTRRGRLRGEVEPFPGLEPGTPRLQSGRSTIELKGRISGGLAGNRTRTLQRFPLRARIRPPAGEGWRVVRPLLGWNRPERINDLTLGAGRPDAIPAHVATVSGRAAQALPLPTLHPLKLPGEPGWNQCGPGFEPGASSSSPD
jgi:hypothetical protein